MINVRGTGGERERIFGSTSQLTESEVKVEQRVPGQEGLGLGSPITFSRWTDSGLLTCPGADCTTLYRWTRGQMAVGGARLTYRPTLYQN